LEDFGRFIILSSVEKEKNNKQQENKLRVIALQRLKVLIPFENVQNLK
jgi:hypothetical protein